MAVRRDNKVVAEEWERVKELFESALDCPPQERAELLSRLQQDDPAVAKQVSDLLVSHEQAGDFLDQPLIFAANFLDDLEEPQRFAPNDVLCNRFKIVRLIGKGGMGEVYEAFDQELEEHVALKTLRFEVSSNEIFTARFRREIQLARKVTHPNVCRIFESLRHQAGHETISVLSMELLQGQTLCDYLKSKGRLTTDEALPLARQIIDGLSAVHSAGIIHRDLKPSNLVLVLEGDGFLVKITDFGIAGRLPENPSQPALTQASKILGTPDYMAPEQLEHGRATIQSDIYSLGLVLYEMVTGAKPFAETGTWKRLYEDARPPQKLAADLPECWNRTIVCCVERDPQYRFSSAKAIAENLNGDNASSPIPSKPLVLRLKRSARKGIWLTLSFLLLIAALAVPVVRYFRQTSEIPPGTTVLVTDIATSDPALAGITVALKSQLAQSAHFEVEEDSKIVDVLKQMNRKPDGPLDAKTARDVARRSGTPLVIFGSVTKNAKGYELSITVEHPINPLFPGASWKQSFTAENETELLGTAVHSAAIWIRQLAGERASELALQDRPVQDTTTSSWLALEQYGEAENRYSLGDINAAITFLREAIRSDRNFAKAHMRLADILISQRHYNEGYVEWKKAFDLVENLTNRETLRIQGQYYADTGYDKEAAKKFGDYTNLYPTDYLAWFYWGSALETSERLEQAIAAFQKASLLRPGSYGPHEHLAALYLLLGRFDDAKRATEQVKTLGSWEWSTWLEGESEFLKGNYDAGLEIIRTLRSSPSEEWQSKSFRYRAKFLAEMGRVAEAILVLEQGAAFDHSHGRAPDESEKLLHLSYLAWLQHDFQTARRHALQATLVDDSPAHLCDAGTLLARSGFVDDARSLLRKLPSLNIPRMVLARKRLSGEIEMAQGRRQAGIEDLKEAQKSSRPRDQQEYLAYAYATAGQQTKAANTYKSLVRNKGRMWLDVDSPFPGLWSNAVFAYLGTPIGAEDPDKCSLFRELLSIRAQAEPSTRFMTDQINSRLRPMCAN